MSKFYQTDEVESQTLLPANSTGIDKTGWGIDAILAGGQFIIQSASVSHSRTEDITQDQKGAQIGALDYDERWDLQLDIIGNSTGTDGEDAQPGDDDAGIRVGNTIFSWNGHYWKIIGVTYAGSFQDKKRWSITAYRTACFPSQTP
jgi:hypothetical protein